MKRCVLGLVATLLVWWIRGIDTLVAALRAAVAVASRRVRTEPERGDVPGWVMVTLMSAGLVAVIWILADDWLRQLFQQAVDRVSGP